MMDKQINLLIDSSGYVGMADHIPIHPAGRPGGIDAAGYKRQEEAYDIFPKQTSTCTIIAIVESIDTLPFRGPANKHRDSPGISDSASDQGQEDT